MLSERSCKRHCSEDTVCGSPDRGSGTDLPNVLTQDELQALEYVNELISHGIRSFATGWLLEDTKMSLWYIDRMGAVQASRFDILREPHYLLLVVAAMSFASIQEMGVSRLLSANSTSGKQFENWDGMMLELDEADTDVGKVPDLQFELAEPERILVDYGAVGRGTTIASVRPTGRAMEKLHLEDDRTLVAKIAWPPAYRRSEGEFVQKIRQRLIDRGHINILKHLVDIKCSMSRTMAQAGLPRALMDLGPAPLFEERICRCFVMTRYERLEMVNSVDEFKRVFIDVVRGTFISVAVFSNLRLTTFG